MHKQIINVLWVMTRRLELLRCEPRQSFLKHEYPERIHTIDERIYPQIELQPIDQVGIIYILLCDVLITRL